MQTANNTQTYQPAVTSANASLRFAQANSGPTIISPELLRFVGGGNGAASPPAKPTAPNNGW